jgi:hypothetical protein
MRKAEGGKILSPENLMRGYCDQKSYGISDKS